MITFSPKMVMKEGSANKALESMLRIMQLFFEDCVSFRNSLCQCSMVIILMHKVANTKAYIMRMPRKMTPVSFVSKENEGKFVNGRCFPQGMPGIIQIDHGWNKANVNILTDDSDLDPISGYPNMKIVPARVENISKKLGV
jgi:hypothetical protein